MYFYQIVHLNKETCKHKAEDQEPLNKEVCTVCKKKKAASMIACVCCGQWQHCSCIGIKYKDAKKLLPTFLCEECKKD